MKNTENTKLLIPTFRGFKGVTINNIIYCQADNYYSKVFLLNETEFTATITLKALEELINCDTFFRCHNSYIINIQYFSEFEKSKNHIHLENNQIIKLSKFKKKEFTEFLNEFIKKNPIT